MNNHVLNENCHWLDKPSELFKWWWFIGEVTAFGSKMIFVEPIIICYSQYKESDYKGKWCKAIVPEIPKE